VEEVPPDVLAWAEAGLHCSVLTTDRMAGGIDAETFRLRLADGSEVVLRVTEVDHHEDIAYLARVLDLLATTAVPAPRHLAHATEVVAGGPPAMLQSLLGGDRSIPVEPEDAWLRGLVSTIERMHQVQAEPWMHDRAAVGWSNLADIAVDELSAGDRALFDVLRDRGPEAPLTPVFGHDDLWVGNTLRDGNNVVGVVDWGHAGIVSAARDATYCAVDASICYGLDVGDRLVDLFTAGCALQPEELLVWTARSVLSSRYFSEWLSGWNGLGVPVSHEQAERRRTELLDRTLARLG
jgi:aminoglycoside phosphotransferase (APT) family kinase protein